MTPTRNQLAELLADIDQSVALAKEILGATPEDAIEHGQAEEYLDVFLAAKASVEAHLAAKK